METVDLVKLETAIKYVERIAEGNNPVNSMPLEEDADVYKRQPLRRPATGGCFILCAISSSFRAITRISGKRAYLEKTRMQSAL